MTRPSTRSTSSSQDRSPFQTPTARTSSSRSQATRRSSSVFLSRRNMQAVTTMPTSGIIPQSAHAGASQAGLPTAVSSSLSSSISTRRVTSVSTPPGPEAYSTRQTEPLSCMTEHLPSTRGRSAPSTIRAAILSRDMLSLSTRSFQALRAPHTTMFLTTAFPRLTTSRLSVSSVSTRISILQQSL